MTDRFYFIFCIATLIKESEQNDFLKKKEFVQDIDLEREIIG